jgi:hypothetical protein
MVLDTVRTMYAERMDMAQALEDTAAIIMSLELCLTFLLQTIMVAFHLLVRGLLCGCDGGSRLRELA